jgi:hypothetical protein
VKGCGVVTKPPRAAGRCRAAGKCCQHFHLLPSWQQDAAWCTRRCAAAMQQLSWEVVAHPCAWQQQQPAGAWKGSCTSSPSALMHPDVPRALAVIAPAGRPTACGHTCMCAEGMAVWL